MSQMTTPEEHAARGVPPTPSAFSVASTGAAAFQSWLMEEEEEWRMGRLLEAKCPKEFICPISLDIMADPIILVRLTPRTQAAKCLETQSLPSPQVEEAGSADAVLSTDPSAMSEDADSQPGQCLYR